MSEPFHFGKGRPLFGHNKRHRLDTELHLDPIETDNLFDDNVFDLDYSEQTDLENETFIEDTVFESISESNNPSLIPNKLSTETTFNFYLRGAKLIQGNSNVVIKV